MSEPTQAAAIVGAAETTPGAAAANDWAIRMRGIGKRYARPSEGARRRTDHLAEAIMRALERPEEEAPDESTAEFFWALRDIDLDVRRGETIGIIGRNGAGKSTLLKILSRIVAPTTGELRYRGRLAALIEVGTGFHQELTGRENIFLNGAILGMKRSEVGRQVHQVLEFAGPRVRQFIDAPVKHYSSGMKVRLGFAVSAHIRNEILVIDEVLSVGDAEFRERSLEKMREIARSGRTILFVSHSMPQVRDLCARTLLLEDGRLVVGGETSDVIREYLKPAAPPPLTAHFEPTRDPALPLQFVELELVDAAGRRCVEFDLADPIRVDFRIKVDRPTKGAALTIQILQGKQILAMSFDTDFARAAGNESIAGERGGSIQIPPMLLKPGEYDLTFHTGVPGVELFQKLQSALRFRVTARSIDAEGKAYAAKRPGGFILKAKWSVNAPIEG